MCTRNRGHFALVPAFRARAGIALCPVAGTLFCPENYGNVCPDSKENPREVDGGRLTGREQKRNMLSASPSAGPARMSSRSQPDTQDDDGLEAAVDQAIAACGGDMRSAVRALIVANEYLETEVGELMKAVSHAYARGRFQSYSG